MNLQWDLAKVKRHLQWLREAGPKALIEEDDLDIRQRVTNAVERRRYTKAHPLTGPSLALWVLGAQRSGTNMAVRGLAKHGGVQVYNENSGKAFTGFELHPAPTIRRLIDDSSQAVVAFKPLCDSDRAVELLEEVSPGSRALWVYRTVDARARSAVAKFGDANLNMMRTIVADEGPTTWWNRAVDPELRETIASLDPSSMSALEASALFWWMRNQLYFDQKLDVRDDVRLVKYEELLHDPTQTMQAICEHIGLSFEPRMVDHFEPYRSSNSVLELNPKIRALCDDLTERLDAVAR